MQQYIKIFSDEYAEPLFNFICETQNEFFEKNDSEGLSMAEYVMKYKASEFLRYLIENGYIPSDAKRFPQKPEKSPSDRF